MATPMSRSDVPLPGDGNLRPCVTQIDIYHVGGRADGKRVIFLPGVAVTCVEQPFFGQAPAQSRLDPIVSAVATSNNTPDISALISCGGDICAKGRCQFL